MSMFSHVPVALSQVSPQRCVMMSLVSRYRRINLICLEKY